MIIIIGIAMIFITAITFTIVINYKKISLSGLVGEWEVKRILKKYQKHHHCYIINDYRTYYKDTSIQIDHILIAPNLIICIETKNYNNCKIYGKANDYKWTLKYKNSKETREMYNPIRQNENHIKFLHKLLGKNIPIINAVVFTGNADIKQVYNYNEIFLKWSFKNCLYNLNEKINYDYPNCYDTLISTKTKISNREHIQNIQKYIE